MKNRKTLILIVVNIGIIVGLIVVGFVLYSKYLKISPSPSLSPSSPSPLIPAYNVDPNILLALFESCLTGEEEPPLDPKTNWSDTFYLIVKALSERDEKACFELKEDKNECLKYFYIFKNLTEKKINYCKKLKPVSSSSGYLACLALEKNDTSYCQKIEDSLSKEICFSFFESERCNYLSGTFPASEQSFRLEGYGIGGKKIIKEEEEIGEEEEAKTICKKAVSFVKAIREKNPTICNLPEFKKDTFNTLICQILSTSEPEKEWQSLRQKICYEKFGPTLALLKKDSSFCEKIPFKDDYNQGLYNSCLAQIE